MALLAMLAVILLGTSYILVSNLYSAAGLTNVNRHHNAKVLSQAKQALIGYVAMTAAQSSENNPGRLPCPEAPGSFGNSLLEGIASGNCSLPAVGRLPWRTLGLDKLVDAAGEPLWYVVSPGWALVPPGTGFLTINSNTPGQLSVDAVGDSVALVIAPGAAFSVPAATGCTAWSQVRPTAGAPDPRNYFECENANWPVVDTSFATTGPSGSFNDQALRLTAAELLPAIEAAIAFRTEREIAPKLRQVYTSANGWTLPVGATALFPFAATFADPESTLDADTGNYPDRGVFKGVLANYQGLAPLARQVPGSVAWINPATGFTLNLLSGSLLSTTDCSTSTSTVFRCSIFFLVAGGFTLDVYASNIGTGFRDAPGIASNLTVTNGSGTVSNLMQADGSARVRIQATPSFPLLGTVTVQLAINAADSAIDDIFTNNAWYFRNGWHKLSLYAVSAGLAPGAVGACGGANPACLTINDAIYPVSGRHATLMLAGRALPSQGQSRPNSTLANYLEGENLSPLDETLRRGAATSTINDRVVALGP